MAEELSFNIIARIHSDFPTKFGIPRQSGLVQELKSRIVFEPEYRDENALRGIEQFTHLWLIWNFSESKGWSPTVRPPRLGGNLRLGVFATRSPFRPNPIGLSAVRLEGMEIDPKLGPVLHIACADLMDGTPILDIKPYIPYADAHPEAAAGYTAQTRLHALNVDFPEALLARIPPEKRAPLRGVLAQYPRPSYQDDPARVYGFGFAGWEIRFRVAGETLTVVDVAQAKAQ